MCSKWYIIVGDVFENFWNMSLEIYDHDHTKFLSSPGLAWQAALKKTEVKLDPLTDIKILWMAEKGIREGICHCISWYVKTNSNYILYIFNIGIWIIYMVGKCCKRFQ